MEIKERLYNLLSKTFKYPLEKISNHTKIINEDLNLNSMQMIKLIISVEKEFNIKFDSSVLSENHFMNVESLGHLIDNTLEG